MTENVIKPSRFKPSRQQSRERPWYRPGAKRIAVVFAVLTITAFLWFLFTAKSVSLVFDPDSTSISISGGFNIELGDIHLLRSGNYTIEANQEGYFPLKAPLTVGSETNQEFIFSLKKLPGLVLFQTSPDEVDLLIDGTAIGKTPMDRMEIPAGLHRITANNPRYQELQTEMEVTGLNAAQTITLELTPNWAEISFSSKPVGALISIDNVMLTSTPSTVKILAGEHEVKIKLKGYKTWIEEISIEALIDQTLPEVTLIKADGLIFLASSPSGASITVDGKYRGDTPLEINIKPGVRHTLDLFKPGYAPLNRNVLVTSGQEQKLSLHLSPLAGDVLISVLPSDAILKIDGLVQNNTEGKIRLSALAHSIELSKPGYAGYKTTLTPTPGFTQEVKVKLLTIADARIARLKPAIKTTTGYELLLFSPDNVQMGASRREPGRRANEVLRSVKLSRMFYIGTKEVSNAEFRLFAKGHSSGNYEEQDLDKSDQPAVRVSWQEAALYCNWLSKKDGLTPFYTAEFGAITGSIRNSTGYRLPTEAEWAWLARGEPGTPRFPWGRALPPPDRHGNYADRSSAHLVGRIIFGYNDNYLVTAPVATFPPDARKLYDLSGNVSEWINDFYEIPKGDSVTDPMGPLTGEYHLIRGSSWMDGTVTDLRLSFRDYGREGRQDLGFRIARFAE